MSLPPPLPGRGCGGSTPMAWVPGASSPLLVFSFCLIHLTLGPLLDAQKWPEKPPALRAGPPFLREMGIEQNPEKPSSVLLFCFNCPPSLRSTPREGDRPYSATNAKVAKGDWALHRYLSYNSSKIAASPYTRE